MTCEAAFVNDHGPAIDQIKDCLHMSRILLAVQVWRSSIARQREKISSLAGRIRLVIDQYEQRRGLGVRFDANSFRAVTEQFDHQPFGHHLTLAEGRSRDRKPDLVGPASLGLDLVFHLVRDLGGALVTANNGTAVRARLPAWGADVVWRLRNITAPEPRRPRAHAHSQKEYLHDLRHS